MDLVAEGTGLAVEDAPVAAGEPGPVTGARPRRARGQGRSATSEPELPAHLLRRILSLTTSVGPDTSLESVSHRLAQVAREMSESTFSVVFFYDSTDDAFYAEARDGLLPEDWQELLAVAIPRRVYGRVTSRSPGLVELRPADPILADEEVSACFAPLQRGGAIAGEAGAGPHTVLLVPLTVLGRGTIGFLACARPTGGSPASARGRVSSGLRRALEALATQGAIFIENIHLYRMQSEEAAVSSALLQVANAVGTTDVDLLVQRTLGILPRLFGAQFAALIYLDHRRGELRMLEPKGPDGALTALTEILVSPARLEQLAPLVRGKDPVSLEEAGVGGYPLGVLPDRLVQTRGLRSALLMPLDLSNRPADALAVFWTAASHRFRPRDFEVARGVSELVAVALANARLFSDATARAEQLASLYRTGQMMSSSLDLDDMLRTITAAAVQLTRSVLCAIYLIDTRSGLLEYVAGAGYSPGGREQATGAGDWVGGASPAQAGTFVPATRRAGGEARPQGSGGTLRPGEGLLGRCALLGKPILVDDLLAEPSVAAGGQVFPGPGGEELALGAVAPAMGGSRSPAGRASRARTGSRVGGGAATSPAAGVRAALFLPLIAGGEVIGVLATGADTPGFFAGEHQQILQAFANQAAVAIERGRLYAAELRRREVAELQQSMTQSLGSTLELRDVVGLVLRFAGTLIGYDLAAVHVLDGGRVDLAVAMAGDGAVTEGAFHGPYLLNEPLYAGMRDSGGAVVVSDTSREPLWRAPRPAAAAASWIGAPLLSDGDYFVVLDLFSNQAGRYEQFDADTVAQFTHQVGFAVRNARIYAREREAKMRLVELDQLRTDFVSTVSHELRTPLTGIKGFTETLLTYWTRLDDARRQHYLDRIYGASKRLQRLVQDLLFVSKVEGGSLPLTIRRVALEDLLEAAVMEIKQKYRGQVVEVAVPGPLPEVLADADRAQQVLVNLMDNGVKYSPEGSEIVVRCDALPTEVRLAVIDHGPGIRPQDMPRLFTRFGKIDQVIRAGHVGTGLGLFISKQLVEQMQGTIAVKSVVGEGSEFSFTLPRAVDADRY